MLQWNLWKTQGKHTCCMGTCGKRKENTGVALEPMEKATKTIVCCVGTDWKHKENIGFEWEPIENTLKTQLLRRNLLKTQGKYECCVETYGKQMEKLGFALEPIEN